VEAKIQPRIDIENRTKLETVIPLNVPFIINVDPSDACNFQCKFCPTGDRELMKNTAGRNFGVMDFDVYKKIIDDICEFERPIKVLRLYKDGEPLVNQNFSKMVKYAVDSGCCERVDTTTNASLLTPELSDQIIEAGLTRINISIEGMTQKQYIDFAKHKVDFENLVSNIRYFYENRKQCEMIVKINGDFLSKEDEENFYKTFGDIADGVFVEHVMECWPEFALNGGLIANSEFGIYKQQIKEVQACPYVFYSFAINSDGRVSSCFLDWSRKLIVGDTRTESVKDIWYGTRLKTLQKLMLNKKRKSHPVCGNCGQMTHGQPDDIDAHADNLIAKVS
tara:strand:+ start:1398 stop:2405 length:1008 start_codon:yes stop_codon:yes gene_type:complete